MPDQKYMYCVSSGDYSGYRVLCVCDSEKRAKTVVKKLKADEDSWRSNIRVEAIAYVDLDPEQVTVYHMTVEVYDDGSTEPREPWETHEWPFDGWDTLDKVNWRWVRAPVHKQKGGRLDIHGTDQEMVRHIYSDTRAQLLAEDAFRLSKEIKGRVK